MHITEDCRDAHCVGSGGLLNFSPICANAANALLLFTILVLCISAFKNIANRLGVLLRLVMVMGKITSRMMGNAGRIGQVHERTRICLAVCNDMVGGVLQEGGLYGVAEISCRCGML